MGNPESFFCLDTMLGFRIILACAVVGIASSRHTDVISSTYHQAVQTGEAHRNIPHGHVRKEYDMVFTPHQMARHFGGGPKGENSTAKRNSIGPELYWTDATLVYEWFHTFTAHERSEIKKAMAIWSKETCIKFREKRAGDKHYIRLKNNWEGCWAHVGEIGKEWPGYGAQTLNLASNGCTMVSVALHELGHSIGLHHEHSRADRDQHINFRKEWMLDASVDNAEISTGMDLHGTKYDYRSIMHYGQMAFAKEATKAHGEPVMVAKTGNHGNPNHFLMGESPWLTFKDIQIVNEMYGCAAKKKTCSGGGEFGTFVDKYGDCRCEGNPSIMKPTRKCSDPKIDTASKCYNSNRNCNQWADSGECEANPSYMLRGCHRGCGLCGKRCQDNDTRKNCCDAKRAGRCLSDPVYSLDKCRERAASAMIRTENKVKYGE